MEKNVERVFNKGGRPKGVPNTQTTRTRAALARLVEGNLDRLDAWLGRIAEDNPKAAFDCLMSVIEYHIPKLARSENVNLNIGQESLTKEQRDAAFKAYMLAQSRATGQSLDISQSPLEISEERGAVVVDAEVVDGDPTPVQTITHGAGVPVPVSVSPSPTQNQNQSPSQPTPLELAKKRIDADFERRRAIYRRRKKADPPPSNPPENTNSEK